MKTMKDRGWTTIKVYLPTYLRLEKRILTKKETWDSVICRLVDKIERYEDLERKNPDFFSPHLESLHPEMYK